jgi:hypothetical protein
MRPVVVRLMRTCFAYPEQYDAFIGEEKVGYLRLRHGHFTVECPDVRGEMVYEASPWGDGIFDDECATSASSTLRRRGWRLPSGGASAGERYVG